MKKTITVSTELFSNNPHRYEFVIQANCDGRWIDTKWGGTTLDAAKIVAEHRIDKDDCWMTDGDRFMRIVKRLGKI